MQIFQSPHSWPKRSWWSHPCAYTVIYQAPLLPGGLVGKSLETQVLPPGFRRSPGGGNGSPRQYSCLENLMDRGAWQASYSPWGRKESETAEDISTCLHTTHPHPLYILSLRTLLSSFLDYHLVNFGSSSVMPSWLSVTPGLGCVSCGVLNLVFVS